MSEKKIIKIYIDGGSRGNPGPGAAGVLIRIGRKKIKLKKYFKRCTNNYAEYSALLLALHWLSRIKDNNYQIKIYSDSLLLVKQIIGKYKVKSKNLKPLHKKAQALIKNLPAFKFEHIPREKNKIADGLVNEILDKMKD